MSHRVIPCAFCDRHSGAIGLATSANWSKPRAYFPGSWLLAADKSCRCSCGDPRAPRPQRPTWGNVHGRPGEAHAIDLALSGYTPEIPLTTHGDTRSASDGRGAQEEEH